MVEDKDVKKLLEKVERVTKQKDIDLSSDEDLSIAIMNLISIEEHLFFTAEKTSKSVYYNLLREVREMRKELLKKIIKEYEGEVWCISKHLLASSMRLMEVGTKQLGHGKKEEAKDLFKKAYQLYSLFWAINLDVINTDDLKKNNIISAQDIEKMRKEESSVSASTPNLEKADKGFFDKITEVFKKAIDCCKE
ncbi:MAG: hypothetical protein Q8L29_04325 [archaeon]|nr:hypothetical protein [archaeon]